ncbi:hypothetical protein [Maliponia aquimaris]|uniref:Uncharacterized protein n=1 Tax=Maliponia aquimaris TaxID=1673631 RepID=A0A238L687_9RHOB|nr:hypothetical protein [Maliponia aquimaris]SMX50614.1 hypothetical protein MAA8898_04883 [Maliponia aquimaris]
MRTTIILGSLLAAHAAGAAGVDVIEEQGIARMTCTYTVECLDEEACTFAQFGHDMDLPRTLPGDAVLQLGTGPAEGRAAEHNGLLVITAADGLASYMVSTTLDGLARLSVHIADPLTVVTYHGQCEVTE